MPSFCPRAALEEDIAGRIGPAASGFRLLDSNEDGLRWRLALIDSAQHSLDLQYYVWWGDEAGILLMKRVVDAANRGVRVRIIVDDLTTTLLDAAQPQLRDSGAAMVGAHPNIEVRLFNPWRRRSFAGRIIESLGDLDRVNQRMHNKLMIADNRAAVIGGRNIGNAYFGLSSEFNFRDLDTLGIGPVARQASEVFDRFWNSEMGVLIESPGLAEHLTEVMGRDIQLDNAWQVALDNDGSVVWTGPEEVFHSQPARNFWQRAEDVIFMAFPKEIY